MRTIKNDVTKNEANKEILKLRKQIDYWKEQVRVKGPNPCNISPCPPVRLVLAA